MTPLRLAIETGVSPCPGNHQALHLVELKFVGNVSGLIAPDPTGYDDTKRGLVSLHEPYLHRRSVRTSVLGDPSVGAADWLNQPNPLNQALASTLLPGFLERYGDARSPPEHAEVCERFVASRRRLGRRPAAAARPRPRRLPARQPAVRATGPARSSTGRRSAGARRCVDAAYFLGGGLPVEERRAHEEALAARLPRRARSRTASPASTGSSCWEEYRRQCFHGLLMTIAAVDGRRADRARRRHVHGLARAQRAAGDRPRRRSRCCPSRAPDAPARAAPGARRRGPPRAGPEALWNESWYFDAVSDDGDARRLRPASAGCPTRTSALYTACDRAARASRRSCSSTRRAPLPPADDDAQVDRRRGHRAPSSTARSRCERFRVTLRGHRRGLRRPLGAAARRGRRAGRDRARPRLGDRRRPLPVAACDALRDPVPGHAARSASARRSSQFAGPGQRDHSWGARDWWAVDWMWSALHLDDGTPHPRGRGPADARAIGVGYVQRGGELDRDRDRDARARGRRRTA